MDTLIKSEQEYKAAANRLINLMNDICLDDTWTTEFSELLREINNFKKHRATKNAAELSTQE